jgi:hypothetical protein
MSLRYILIISCYAVAYNRAQNGIHLFILEINRDCFIPELLNKNV